jgi:PadR family transcriptional regulator PadR
MTTPTLGEFELTVLLVVSRLPEAHGMAVREAVSQLRTHDYSVGAIYTTRQRLEEKGMVDSTMTEPIPVRGGRSRRQYRVTGAGRKALREARLLATRLWGLNPRLDPT